MHAWLGNTVWDVCTVQRHMYCLLQNILCHTRHPSIGKPQAVAEMLVRNESRIKMIHDIEHFHVPRQLMHTIRIRLKVSA